MFPFFESMALIGGKIRNLSFHQSRINRTFGRFYPGYTPHEIQNINFDIQDNPIQIYKVKLSYNLLDYLIQITPYETKSIAGVMPISQPELNYSYKYTDREILNFLKNKFPENVEILIIKNGKICDTSIHNIILNKNNKWFTPSEPLLNGTMRQFLLYEKKITECEIYLNNLGEYKNFKLINALNSFDDSQTLPIELIKSN